MNFLEKLFGHKPQTREEKVAYAMGVIHEVGTRLGRKYGQNNIMKYLAIYSAGEYMRESLESGDFEADTDNYQGSKCQTRLRKHLEIGITNLVTNGLDDTSADAQIRSRFSYFEKIALDATIDFISTNRKKNPDIPAFLTALRMFYDLAEAEMKKGFRSTQT